MLTRSKFSHAFLLPKLRARRVLS